MDPILCESYAIPVLWTDLLTCGGAPKDRVISSSVLANSEGRRAGNPKHSFPSSMEGSQKQPFSTGRQRNAVTGRPVKTTIRPKTVPSGKCVLLSTRLTGCERSRSEASRILPAKWHRNAHRSSRSVKACAPRKYGPIKRTSLPEIVIYGSHILTFYLWLLGFNPQYCVRVFLARFTSQPKKNNPCLFRFAKSPKRFSMSFLADRRPSPHDRTPTEFGALL
jgi:hypothetical protein